MKYILGAEGLDSLARVARSSALVALDFDGTLAPIVAELDLAEMRSRTRELVAAVSRRYPCAVISGRARSDVASRLEGTGVHHVIGNHGLEPSEGMEAFERVAEQVFDLLLRELSDVGGLDFEHKRYSLAIHYRRSHGREEAQRAITQAVARLPVAMRIVPGRLVVNLVPEGAPDKGEALQRLMADEGCAEALYVGDDVTDEDVFRLGASGDVVGVRVGRSDHSAASWYLDDQREVDVLLERLTSLKDSVRR